MHPNLTHQNDFPPSQPDARAFRKRSKAAGSLRNWFRAAYRRWQRNKMIAAFESLDDATLRDIGVHRGDIRSVVAGLNDQDLKSVPVMATDDGRRWQ